MNNMSILFNGMRGEFDTSPEIIEIKQHFPYIKKGDTIISKIDEDYPHFKYKKGDRFEAEFAGFAKIKMFGDEVETHALIFKDKDGKLKYNNLYNFSDFWEVADID